MRSPYLTLEHVGLSPASIKLKKKLPEIQRGLENTKPYQQ